MLDGGSSPMALEAAPPCGNTQPVRVAAPLQAPPALAPLCRSLTPPQSSRSTIEGGSHPGRRHLRRHARQLKSRLSARPLPEAGKNRPFNCVFNANRSRGGGSVAGPPENEIEGGSHTPVVIFFEIDDRGGGPKLRGGVLQNDLDISHGGRGEGGRRRERGESAAYLASGIVSWAGGSPRTGCDVRIRGALQAYGEGPGRGRSGPISIPSRGQH